MKPKKFRKKPVVIEAMQHKGGLEHYHAICDFVGGKQLKRGGGQQVYIDTLEGEMQCSIGDWLIKGVAGEFYPCKPDIFEASYEEVSL